MVSIASITEQIKELIGVPSNRVKKTDQESEKSSEKDGKVKNCKVYEFPDFKDNPAQHLVFFDIETTIPNDDVIEFAAIVLDRKSLREVDRFETLIYSEKITQRSIECNGIKEDMLQGAPKFEEVSDRIFSVMDGRIWAGHNILSFDTKYIRREFEKLGKEGPIPSGFIDTLNLIREHFGKRAGDLKMNSLGKFFELGDEKHRALADTEMTIQVLKNVCLTLFLEQHLHPFKWDPNPKPKTKKREKKKEIEEEKKGEKKDEKEEKLEMVENTERTEENSQPTEEKTTQRRNPKPKPTKETKEEENSEPNKSPRSKKEEENNETVLSTEALQIHIRRPTRFMNESQIRNKLDDVMGKQMVWISYHGGKNQLVPRPIFPKGFDLKNPNTVMASCNEHETKLFRFTVKKIMDIRDQDWNLEECYPELFSQKQSLNTTEDCEKTEELKESTKKNESLLKGEEESTEKNGSPVEEEEKTEEKESIGNQETENLKGSTESKGNEETENLKESTEVNGFSLKEEELIEKNESPVEEEKTVANESNNSTTES